MFQAGYPLTKRLLNFVYKVSTLSPSLSPPPLQQLSSLCGVCGEFGFRVARGCNSSR